MRSPNRRGPSGRRRGLGGLAVAAVLLASGCGLPHQDKAGGAATSPPAPVPSTPPAPTGTPHGGLPDPKAVDRHDATAVSRAAVQVMWTVDAAIDRGQIDGYLRARPYLTPEYAAELGAEPVGTIPSLWREHRAYARVRLKAQTPEDGVGADTAGTAHRQWDVTVVPTGRDGWTGPPVHAIAFVTLARDAEDRWQVARVDTA